jgi:hypothetical protein
VLPLVEARAREPRWLVPIGAALAVLPWLHTRFALLALTMAAAVAGRTVGLPYAHKRLAAFAVVPIASAVAWFSFFYVIYGTPNPAAPYGGAVQTEVRNLARGAAGLLLDQQFGLLSTAPVFLLAIAGLMAMLWRGPRRLAVELLIVVAVYFVAVAEFHMWWGGYSAPARFLVPLTLLLAIPMAIAFARSRGVVARLIAIGMLVVSLTMTSTIAAIDRGALLINTRDGASLLLLWLSPAVNLTLALPSLFQNPPAIVVQHSAIWFAALAAVLVVGAALERLGWRTSVLIVVVGYLSAAAVTASTSLVWRRNRAAAITPARGAVAILRRYEPDASEVAVTFPPIRRVSWPALPRMVPLADVTPGTIGPGAPLAVLPRMPAGIYEIAGASTDGASGTLGIGVTRQLPPLASWKVDSFERHWTRSVTVPVAVSAIRLEADAAARSSIRQVTVRAAKVFPRKQRPVTTEASHATRYGPAIVFLVGGAANMETDGAWVHGAASARFVIAPDSGPSVHLFVRNSPVDNLVVLESGAWRRELNLLPREERLVELPAESVPYATVLTVTTSRGVRPIDVDRNTTDERFLGCWIETR